MYQVRVTSALVAALQQVVVGVKYPSGMLGRDVVAAVRVVQGQTTTFDDVPMRRFTDAYETVTGATVTDKDVIDAQFENIFRATNARGGR